jgi:exonuclease V gamma subunit
MATDRLTIIRNGADISTGRPVDLATVRAELGDAITAVLEPDTELMSISHARHGFHDDSFSVTAENVEPLRAAGLVRGPWSFSAREFTMNTQRTRTSRASLAALDDEPITLPERLGLDAIERFLRRPAETFVRESLGLVLESNDRPRSDDIAGLIDGWDYSVGLRALLRGDESAERVSTADGFYALTQSGRIPPEPLSNYSTLDAQVRQYREQVEIACDGIAPRVRPFRLTVPVGDRTVSLEGELELYESDSGTRLVEIVESTLSLRALISPWLRTVIARALVEGPLTVHLIARVGSVDATKVVTKIVDIPTDPSTLATLTELLTWYERNLREPLPFDVNWPKRDGGSKIALTEEIIRQQAKWLKSSRAIFMAEPYWRFALGHWSAEELVAGAAGIGVYEMYEQFDALLNRHLPIIDWSDSSNWETGS